MMKKIFAVALLAASANVAMADQDTGCGLGTMLFAGKSGPIFKSLAVTTNGFYSTNTFAITSGTLGCQTNGTITSRARLGMFTGSNLDNLARDMSVGHGESLNVLADLMGVKDADKDRFFQATKTNFSKIFSADSANAGQVLASLEQVMSQDAVLAAYVKA
jgi:hypothetical protein